MPDAHGRFCWFELITTDRADAARFYGAVMDWTASASERAVVPYTLLRHGRALVAGMMDMADAAHERGAIPFWGGFVAVDDVDDSAARVRAAGGAIAHEPTDIPAIGRFAVMRDPFGALLVLFRDAAGTARGGLSRRPGHGAWAELHSTDPERALAFYHGLFGWTGSTTHDMGPLGAYRLFAHGGADIGGMVRRSPGIPRDFWGYYFMVDGIDAAVVRVRQAGGGVVAGPHQVPGGDWIIQARDPQGAYFALVAGRR